jgi:hypothetical protein
VTLPPQQWKWQSEAMTAHIDVTHQAGVPPYWRIVRQVGDHVATWTYLDEHAARQEAERMARWPDDYSPQGWPLGHLYEREQ